MCCFVTCDLKFRTVVTSVIYQKQWNFVTSLEEYCSFGEVCVCVCVGWGWGGGRYFWKYTVLLRNESHDAPSGCGF